MLKGLEVGAKPLAEQRAVLPGLKLSRLNERAIGTVVRVLRIVLLNICIARIIKFSNCGLSIVRK